MAGSCGSMRETRNACRVLVGRPEGKIHLEDDIKMDFKRIGRGSVFYIHVPKPKESDGLLLTH